MTMDLDKGLQQQLAQLRDIRLPEEISWWPLAPGWWMLALIIVIVVLVFIFLYVKNKHSLKCQALCELQALKSQSEKFTNTQLATQISVLIRRLVLSQNTDLHYAAMHGTQWQEFLMTNSRSIPASFARVISHAPYVDNIQFENITKDENLSSSDLLEIADYWIRGYA